MVVSIKTPITDPPILPSDFISSTFNTAAIMVIRIKGMIIIRNRFT